MSNLCWQGIFLKNLRAILLELGRKTTDQEAVNKSKPLPGRGSWVRGREKAKLFEPDQKEASIISTGGLGVGRVRWYECKQRDFASV